jgi:hypothetical protein
MRASTHSGITHTSSSSLHSSTLLQFSDPERIPALWIAQDGATRFNTQDELGVPGQSSRVSMNKFEKGGVML